VNLAFLQPKNLGCAISVLTNSGAQNLVATTRSPKLKHQKFIQLLNATDFSK
jgi:hypothetical protein